MLQEYIHFFFHVFFYSLNFGTQADLYTSWTLADASVIMYLMGAGAFGLPSEVKTYLKGSQV